MQHIYMHSHHEHLEVFTTVLAPQGQDLYGCNDDKENLPHKPRMRRRRSASQRAASSSEGDGGCVRRNSASGHVLQALRRASRSGGEADASEAPASPWRSPPPPAPLCLRGTPQTQRSPCLLHKILSRCRRKSECQGATNGAFEGD